MLKKIVVGILCFLILAVTGIGIYIYTLNWNNHKDVVAKRFSQITGLKAIIDGNLKVELLPTPKFSANMVRFIDNNPRQPLIEVNEISANIELMPLLKDKFILNSMSLNGATVHLNISENGDFNWKGVSKKGRITTGNLEVSFNDIRLVNSTISYNNKLTEDTFELPGISGTIKAQSIEGPYRINGRFRHNEHDILFSGDVVNGDNVGVRLNVSNEATGSEIKIDGSLGKTSKGNITFNSKNLYNTMNVAFGNNAISDTYNKSLFLSFQYNHSDQTTQLDNFTVKYGSNTAGSGVSTIKKGDKINIDADFDMLQFDLGLLEDIARSIIASQKQVNENKNKIKYSANISVKSNHAVYRNADAQKLNFGISFNNDNIIVNRFAVTMPGETVVKSVGKINLLPKFDYIFNQTIDAQDIKSFASLMGIDLTKHTSLDNRKNIFKRAQADFNISGDLNAVKISVAKAIVDSTTLSGNIGLIFKKDKNIMLIQADASKILFDNYLQLKTADRNGLSVKKNFVHQINLAPWKGNFETDATIHIANAVYNGVPIEGLDISFIANNDKLEVTKFSAASIAQAQLNLKANIDKVYTDPYFNELTYDIQTNNFPMFASAIGIDTGSKPLFKRKLFASQGALSGSFSEFSLSSVQKFGDVEFTYSGVVNNYDNKKTAINGSVELKSNNFKSFVKDLGFNYTPDIPVTAFALSGNFLGQSDLFEANKINAYLGANHIQGTIKLDNTNSKPKLLANLNFDTFDVNRMFNISRTEPKNIDTVLTSFIEKPIFSDKKIDFSPLGKIDFDIKTNINQLIWNNTYYSNFEGKAILNDKILNVSNLSAQRGNSFYNFDFIINSKNLPNIKGNFDLNDIDTPMLGGKTYRISKALLDANGSFNSIITSQKDFYENLNSKGRYELSDFTIYGWDFDIIKFEFEQRKTLDGFIDTIANSLKSNSTKFNNMKGKYNIIKGVVVADDTVITSPVADINMDVNLNLANWKFNSEYNVFYHNASFSDVLEYSFIGDLDNPTLKLEIDNVVNRIGKIEQVIMKEKEDLKKKKIEQLQNKIKSLNLELDNSFNSIDRISLDVARFKPVTSNPNVNKVYNSNIEELKDINSSLKELKDLLSKSNDEKALMDIEANLAKEISRINIIPRVLEENFVVDSKYVFDDIFSKLTWLFNLAQNNSSYFNSLTDVYMTQVDILKSTDEPLSEQKVSELQASINAINDEMAKIDEFYTVNRDSYLKIIDTNSVNEMGKNNANATQSLKTMLDDVKKLNSNIVKSIDLFRSALGLHSRDYDLYMVFPPETIDAIDTSLPTDKNSSDEMKDELAKKKQELTVSLNNATNGIASLYNKLKQQKRTKDLTNIDFSGLSSAIKNAKSLTLADTKEPEKDASLEPVVIVENIDIAPLEEKTTEETEIIVASNENLTEYLPVVENNISTPALDNNENNDSDKVLENKSLTKSIISKTKEALANLMSSITKKEKEITNNILPTKVEITEDIKDIAINDTNIDAKNLPEVETNEITNTHKVNPVIAMDLDKKEEANDIELAISNVKNTKTGFTTKESTKEINVAQNKNIIAKQEEKVDSKKEFIKLFANTNDNFVKTVNVETPKIITQDIVDEDVSNSKKYVFATSSLDGKFSGNIGKKLLKNKSNTLSNEINKKYVFNKSSVKEAKFNGEIGKIFAVSAN